MKTIPIALKNHLAQETTTLVACLRLAQVNVPDPVTLGFTDHDCDLVIDDVVYSPVSGVDRTEIVSNSELSVDNVSAKGALFGGVITEADIRAGRWDFAVAEIFITNWADLSQGVMRLRYGRLGEVSTGRNVFELEVRGLMQSLSTSIGKLTQPGCRHSLGDAGCQVDLGPLTVTGSVETISADGLVIEDSARTEAGPTAEMGGYFQGGVITMTSGAAAGLRMEVRFYQPGKITLQLPFPYQLDVGDTYSMHAGCDRLHTTCRDRFDNIVNFDGEWMLPGNDAMMQTARVDG